MLDFKNQTNTENSTDDRVRGGDGQAHSCCDGQPSCSSHHCRNEPKCDVLREHSINGTVAKINGKNSLAHRICYSVTGEERTTEFEDSSDDHGLLEGQCS